MCVSEWKYLVYDCGQVLGAGQRLEELYAQQGGHRVGQHVLYGAGWCGDTEDEHDDEDDDEDECKDDDEDDDDEDEDDEDDYKDDDDEDDD